MRTRSYLLFKSSNRILLPFTNFRIVLIILALTFCSSFAFAQKYKVTWLTPTYVLNSYSGTCDQESATVGFIDTPVSYGDNVLYFDHVPTQLFYWSYIDRDPIGQCVSVFRQCEDNYTVDLALNDCDYFSYYFGSSCYNPLGEVSFTIEPVLSPLSGSGTYCENQNVTLNAKPGYSSYTWQYQIQSGGWNTFATNSNSSFSVSIQGLFGSNYTSYLNQNIYFRYTVGNCNSVYSDPTSAILFEPPQATGTFTTTTPTCPNGSDGSINVSAYSRSPISGEAFNYEIHTSPDINVSSLVSSANLPAGNYYGVVESNLGCGSLVFTPITIPAGPRNALSATAAVSTPYNGYELSCPGAANGQIQVSASGGNGSFSYSIDNGTTYQSSNTISSLGQGSYTLKVKDGCSTPNIVNTNTVSVDPPPPIAISSVTLGGCNTGSSGQITISANSGVGSLSYSIDNGSTYQSSNVFSSLSAGNYSVVVKDSNGCTKAWGSTVTILNPVTAGTVTFPNCPSSSSISLSSSGASGGSNSYQWEVYDKATNNLVGSAPSVSNSIAVSPGSYYAKIIDSNHTACSAITADFTVNSPLSGGINQTSSINCFGQSTAALIAAPSGGTGSYSYSWSNSSTAQSINSLPAGTYSVTITDTKPCSVVSSIIVSQPAQLTASTSTSDYNGFNISCKGGSNGSINLSPSGGTSPFTYAWSNNSTSQNLSGLAAGTYTVTVTDAKSCTASTGATLTEPSTNVSVSLQSKSNVTCFGANNGVVTVTGSGGTGALSYTIDGANYQLSSTFSSLAANSYTVTARDANSCTVSTSSISITTPTALAITSIVKNNPLCNGSSNGSLVITASGGTSPYTYSKDGTTFSSSGSFSGLTAGSYILTEKDANGCTISSATQVLTDPTLLALSYTASPQSCTANIDGTLSLSGTGGTPSFTFSINAGASFQSSGNFSALSSGIYQTRVKDNNGCVTSGTATVNLQPTLSGNITPSSSINCYGQSTGALSLAVSGGTSPYTYAWSNGPTTQNISSLSAGNYSVTIKDSKNCLASQNYSLTQPTDLVLSAVPSDYNGYGVSCQSSSDGFITLTVNGGTPGGGPSPYSYSWSNGATSKNISGLTSGSYTVTVTDSKSCTKNLPATITAPSALTIGIASKTNVTCNSGTDGSVTLSASGGVSGYNYSINGGATWQAASTFSSLSNGLYTIQLKDLNNCITSTTANITQPSAIGITIGTIQNAGCGVANGSIQSSASGGTGALSYTWRNSSNAVVGTSANLANAFGGTYSLVVTDQSLCSASTTASISNPNGPVFSLINLVPTSCSNTSDGKADVSITSGQGPYTVSWGDGETGNSALHLIAGSNTVSVTDGNNCITSQNFTITSPPAISLSSVQNNSPACPGGSDGSIQVSASGGQSPYSYSWNATSGTSTLSNISAGTYSLIVTDANNCTFSQSIGVVDVPVIAINVVNQVNPTCSGSADASLVVNATGGNGSFNYSWSNSSSGPQLNSVGAGTYIVTATDRKNCSQQKSIDVVAPVAVSSSLVATATSCYGGSDGIINVSPSGGIGPFAFSKDNGNTWQVQNSFAGLPAGNYTIATKDQNGCLGNSTTAVSQPAAIQISIAKTDPTCGLSNGHAQATISGGTGAYTFQWINSVSQSFGVTANLQNAPADSYVLTVTDANFCLANKAVVFTPYASSQFGVGNITSTLCSYSADGSATVQVTTVQSPYSISWSSGESTTTAIKLIAGQNSVTIKDVNNCTVTKTFQVPSPQTISLNFETIANPVCVGGTGSIQVTPTGGAGNFIYSWNGVAGPNNIQNIKAGPYDLIIKDNNGCSFAKTYTLSDPPPFVIDLGPDETICPRTSTSKGVTFPNATYVWTGPNNFSSSQGIVSVGTAGNYQLTVTNAAGCKASDEVTITISNNLLKADFLTVSNAHMGDTLMIIDISWPIPDQIKWLFSDTAKMVSSNSDYALISFSDPGTYTVGITATLGGCQDTYYQKITIDNKPRHGEPGHNSGDPAISTFAAYPNPFIGRTNARIELSEQGTATLKVYSLVTNLLIMSHEFSGDSAYEAEIDFTGREAGLYVIIVESGSKTKAVRVVKL